jgi:ribosomally synthesized peptide (two-chain TOMM family)
MDSKMGRPHSNYDKSPKDDAHAKAVVHPLVQYDKIAQWERVWTEAIALAWREWDQPNGFKEKLQADARGAIRTQFGFMFPGDCELEVKVGNKGDWSWDEEARVFRHPRAVSHLTLTLPFRPEEAEDRPMALANYVATGQSMPFTCCCCC